VVAAVNDYNDFGAGSVSSPANSEGAIAVGAVEIGSSPTTRTHAEFSSVGPTTISLRLKPDVAAPGVDVLSSVPGGGWSSFSGTSMAAPHIAGSAALLRQRHPSWSAEQVKSALVQSGVDALLVRNLVAGPRFQGGGVVALVRADQPLLFARPTALSFGLLERGRTSTRALALEDAGGGAGAWKVEVVTRAKPRGVRVVAPPTTSVPGPLSVALSAAARATAGDVDAYIELRRGSELRRIPLWGRVSASALAKHRVATLLRPGVYRSTTASRPALVSRYRYPEAPSGIGVTTTLRGPERVFRFRIAKRVANAGVVITRRAGSGRVEPRMVAALDENRLTGYAGLPLNRNPYMDAFHESVLAAAVLSPLPGEYAAVFDSAARADAGAFTFRYWVNDVKPPVLRLRTPGVDAGKSVLVSVTDAGAGVYPESIRIVLDDSSRSGTLRGGLLSLSTDGLSAGTHRLRLRVSDYQESKNTENVARILPNTRTATFTFRVR